MAAFKHQPRRKHHGGVQTPTEAQTPAEAQTPSRRSNPKLAFKHQSVFKHQLAVDVAKFQRPMAALIRTPTARCPRYWLSQDDCLLSCSSTADGGPAMELTPKPEAPKKSRARFLAPLIGQKYVKSGAFEVTAMDHCKHDVIAVIHVFAASSRLYGHSLQQCGIKGLIGTQKQAWSALGKIRMNLGDCLVVEDDIIVFGPSDQNPICPRIAISLYDRIKRK